MSTLFDDLPFPRPTASTEAARADEVDAFGVPTWAAAAAAGRGPMAPPHGIPTPKSSCRA